MLFHLKPEFGERLLRNITREEMQSFLEVKACRYFRSVVGHRRWDLNSVFKMARSDGYAEYNPATALFTPGYKPDAVQAFGAESRNLIKDDTAML